VGTIEDPENTRIARAIRTLRQRQGLRQKELAARCDFPQSRVSKLELGQQWIRAVDVVRLAAALHISYDVLLDWPEDATPPA
jgi:transcriptional regulator with XRE-family HTH domain